MWIEVSFGNHTSQICAPASLRKECYRFQSLIAYSCICSLFIWLHRYLLLGCFKCILEFLCTYDKTKSQLMWERARSKPTPPTTLDRPAHSVAEEINSKHYASFKTARSLFLQIILYVRHIVNAERKLLPHKTLSKRKLLPVAPLCS